ncbi:probable glycosyltransferase At5g03795 [Vicia villosa]|uniref:probable glycosyltransferase At5g03795 n=1 Tax=Vicia villosa TaxID=3911 RepID=UPI00273B1448|nr:probable glycosyltransferase At5g03795 [Vicia villosa]
MGQEFFSLIHLERKKLLCLIIVITFALILAFQYFELPYGTNILVQPSKFSTEKTSTLSNSTIIHQPADSTSEIFNNVTLLNQTYSEHGFEKVNETRLYEKNDTVSRPVVIGENLTRDVNNSYASFHSPSPTPASAPTYLTPTPAIAPTNLTPTPASPPTKTLSNDSEIADSMNDERFKPLQDDVNEISSNQSSITILPKENKNSPVKVPETMSISEMDKLLLQNYASFRSMRPRWSSAVDQELLQARFEIENAPVVTDLGNLYAPLFRNVSMFKRSYELMEKTLKVYVYKEGSKPIMHSPYLLGIYASEGWFMRLMEVNKAFVTKDAKKAHLFYLPFSSRMLEETLYDQNSHSHRNLMQYLNNYVDMIGGKHRFWNRTGGADHFLVACHDWAPSETKQRMAKCIRSLCNADVKEGFMLGKDVSLPETYVRNAQNPTRDLGGNPLSRRNTLAFFAGGMHGYVRPILLQHWENKDPDMKIFGIVFVQRDTKLTVQELSRL